MTNQPVTYNPYPPTHPHQDKNSSIFFCFAWFITKRSTKARSQISNGSAAAMEARSREVTSSRIGGLSRVTRDELQELITDAFTKRQEQLEATLARLDRNDAEAAALLRELRDDLVEVRRHGVAVDADAAYMLSKAADELGNLEDSASMLARAADGLGNLEDAASMLNGAADELRRLEDTISRLRSAVSDIRNASGFM